MSKTIDVRMSGVSNEFISALGHAPLIIRLLTLSSLILLIYSIAITVFYYQVNLVAKRQVPLPVVIDRETGDARMVTPVIDVTGDVRLPSEIRFFSRLYIQLLFDFNRLNIEDRLKELGLYTHPDCFPKIKEIIDMRRRFSDVNAGNSGAVKIISVVVISNDNGTIRVKARYDTKVLRPNDLDIRSYHGVLTLKMPLRTRENPRGFMVVDYLQESIAQEGIE